MKIASQWETPRLPGALSNNASDAREIRAKFLACTSDFPAIQASPARVRANFPPSSAAQTSSSGRDRAVKKMYTTNSNRAAPEPDAGGGGSRKRRLVNLCPISRRKRPRNFRAGLSAGAQ